ncbi:hypothetical protein AMS68_000446 [Peltaster fructicola]|uniref:Sialidase n=1 Tax=Peltaster fructicola TaxID=286661 RepID=A0A6H0XJW2_9PEZI|nr:hypothetical protein AMS68_000446 [Peltaster fructicola]
MGHQQTTPPTLEIDEFLDLPCTTGSVGTAVTYLSQDWSPQSALTAESTPPSKSPARLKECGPKLIPRVRTQDQVMERAPAIARHLGHQRTQSLPCSNGYPMQFGGQLPVTSYNGFTPADFFDFGAPASAPPRQTYSMLQVAPESNTAQPIVSPITTVRSHSRNTSASSIDASQLNKYRYPTYRQSPTPQPPGLSCTADAMSHLAPMAMLNGTAQNYPVRSRNTSPIAKSRLSVEVEMPQPDVQQTSLRSYLTRANPTPQTLKQVMVERNGDSFWWDVRNVYEWSDFNVNTILSIDGFAALLDCSVDSSSLPEPGRVNLNPDTRVQLAELCSSHHLYKLNAALAIAQGRSHHLAARSLTPGAASRSQPEFVSNYCSDTEKTIYGNGRGRVVGIVRGFEEWNSGMRGEDPVKRIEYLRGLAALHKQMRDHSCRYGFIVSEIELVCVRAGGPNAPGEPPLFGFLELSKPISISAHGPAADGSLQMTVGIALWYLHMLARDQTLPGQMDWKLDVGGPAAATRRHHLAKDSWIPPPNQSEKRTAKRMRGWCMPDEPISSQERGKTNRKKI